MSRTTGIVDLRRNKPNFRPYQDYDTREKPFVCHICSKAFVSRSGRFKHRRRDHPDAPEQSSISWNGKHVCGKCDQNEPTLKTLEGLCKHLEEKHETKATIVNREFQNAAEFESWKTSVESESRCDFRCRSGYNNTDKTLARKTYHCSRSGHYQPKAQARRAAKAAPTIKAGFTCSAFIRVKHNSDGTATVKACIDHYGHDPSPKKHEALVKSKVAQLIAENRNLFGKNATSILKRPTIRGGMRKKMSAMHQRHRESYQIPEDALSEGQSENEWFVMSSSFPGLKYSVRRNRATCSCILKCKHLNCNVCEHMYSCNCDDDAKRFICCKHIHFVHYRLKPEATVEEEVTSETQVHESPPEPEAPILLNYSQEDTPKSSQKVTHEDLDYLIDEIKTATRSITNQKKLAEIYKRLDQEKQFIESGSVQAKQEKAKTTQKRKRSKADSSTKGSKKKRKPKIANNCGQCDRNWEDGVYNTWIDCPGCQNWFHQVCVERILSYTDVDNFMCGRCLMEPLHSGL